jgi:N-acetylglutamate synthase-like GNAT family acetyltransferase
MRQLRVAEAADVPALQALITRSGLGLSEPYYSRAQAEAVTRLVFGVDSQLVTDRTYLLIEEDGRIVACGGWSKRRTLFGGDQAKQGADPLLDPFIEPARIRAFFVDPTMARRGLGRQLIAECIEQARAAGFSALELASTLPGEPLYLACGFAVVERFELPLPDNIYIPLTRMRLAI